MMELLRENVVYILGFVTFLLSLVDDIFTALQNKNKPLKSFGYYLQEFLYTSLSILVGILVCDGFDFSRGTSILISVMMGLTGSSIIRKIKANRDKISNSVSDKIVKTIGESGVVSETLNQENQESYES